jgi:fumarate reductase flavoprotein subunit
MISKVYPMRSHTVSAEGGAAGVLRTDLGDSFDSHAFDTIKGSDYLADQDAVEVFVREAALEIIQAEHWGCPWNREPDGRISVRPFGGMTTWRTCFAADKTGFHLLHTLFQTSLKYPQIERFDEQFVTSLLVEDGRCIGVTAFDLHGGRIQAITAKSVVLATGGNGRIFAFTTNAVICTGDGMALAYRAGVPLKDMEFVQFHPTGLPMNGILITEAVRGEGGYLLNSEGERFLKEYVPAKMELGPRDMVSRAMITEFEAGRGFKGKYGDYMHLDVRHLGERAIDAKLPFMRELCREFVGIDIVKAPIPVRPVEHYMMGGIETDAGTATSLAGLFAAGECACVSINGANRLGSNSLSEILVFGAAAGRAAAAHALEAKTPTANPVARLVRAETLRIEAGYLRERKGRGERMAEIRKAMQRTMDALVGVFRTEESLNQACADLAELRARFQRVRLDDRSRVFNTELTAALELGFMLDVAEAIAHSALARRESRGAHARRDHPKRDDRHYLAHTLAYQDADAPPQLEYRPVTIKRWRPEARTY